MHLRGKQCAYMYVSFESLCTLLQLVNVTGAVVNM